MNAANVINPNTRKNNKVQKIEYLRVKVVIKLKLSKELEKITSRNDETLSFQYRKKKIFCLSHKIKISSQINFEAINM